MLDNITFTKIVLIGLGFIAVLYLVLRLVLHPSTFQERKDFIELFTKIVGSAVLVVSLIFTWRTTENTLKGTENTLKISTQTLANVQKKDLVERFSKASEQIASTNRQTRIGAIYSLGQIANDSPDYYWPVFQNLAGYVRERAPHNKQVTTPLPATCPTDIQTAMDVIGWRVKRFEQGEDQRLELHQTDLRRLILKDKEISRGNREGAHFEGAQLWEANLEGANLRGIHLEGAILKDAILKDAYLAGAHFDALTDFDGAQLEGADFGGAQGLTLAVLRRAQEWYKLKNPPPDAEIRAEWQKWQQTKK